MRDRRFALSFSLSLSRLETLLAKGEEKPYSRTNDAAAETAAERGPLKPTAMSPRHPFRTFRLYSSLHRSNNVCNVSLRILQFTFVKGKKFFYFFDRCHCFHDCSFQSMREKDGSICGSIKTIKHGSSDDACRKVEEHGVRRRERWQGRGVLHKRSGRGSRQWMGSTVERGRTWNTLDVASTEPVFHPLGIKGGLLLSRFIAGSSGRDSRGARFIRSDSCPVRDYTLLPAKLDIAPITP